MYVRWCITWVNELLSGESIPLDRITYEGQTMSRAAVRRVMSHQFFCSFVVGPLSLGFWRIGQEPAYCHNKVK